MKWRSSDAEGNSGKNVANRVRKARTHRSGAYAPQEIRHLHTSITSFSGTQNAHESRVTLGVGSLPDPFIPGMSQSINSLLCCNSGCGMTEIGFNTDAIQRHSATLTRRPASEQEPTDLPTCCRCRSPGAIRRATALPKARGRRFPVAYFPDIALFTESGVRCDATAACHGADSPQRMRCCARSAAEVRLQRPASPSAHARGTACDSQLRPRATTMRRFCQHIGPGAPAA